ncbi:MAG: large subunit of alpha-aminoadipate reductase, partial [Geoglossum umbratile]
LSARPRIINTVNAVPVNHVARVVVAAALNPVPGGVHVVHVTGHPRLRMNEYLSLLEFYGFKVPEVSYDAWKDELERYVSAGAPELDDRNAIKILKADAKSWTGTDERAGYGISREDVGRFLRYLAETKFVSSGSEVIRSAQGLSVWVTSL